MNALFATASAILVMAALQTAGVDKGASVLFGFAAMLALASIGVALDKIASK